MNKININNNWQFSKDKLTFININIPHTWNGKDGQDGGGDYYRGTCFYYKKIRRNELPNNELIYLEFEGVNSSAIVYINKQQVFEHDGGYSTFRVNITDYLEDDNEIIVQVDNSPNDRVYPQRADFTFYGGIYRNVNIIGVNKIHFDLDHYGDDGIKITPIIKGKNATINFDVLISNKNDNTHVKYEIFDNQKIIDKSIDNSILHIKNVHLWNGMKDPFLYKAKVSLYDGNNLVEKRIINFGCRYFKIDPNRGFILNGKEYPLHGVCRHQDMPGIGNAISKKHHQKDINLIKEMGANAIRLAHYQHDQYFYDLCDKHGFIVWAEIPYITERLENGRDNLILQAQEIVMQNYNHPSIITWGLSNEVAIKDQKDDILNDHIILNDLIHSLDAQRLTTIALISYCPGDAKHVKIPDLIGYNLYFGWYGGNYNMFNDFFENFHKNYPTRPIALSEYGAEALNWHSSNPQAGDYSEEYQAMFHEAIIKQLFKKKYIWGTFVWNMFDFGSDNRQEGGENGINHKGLVTFNRKYKKDAFYIYKAYLSDVPFVHICSKRYVERVEETATIKVYSNQKTVSLYLNGKLYEKKKSLDHIFVFNIPNIKKSNIKVKAYKCFDEARIIKVSKRNLKYSLKDCKIINWIEK